MATEQYIVFKLNDNEFGINIMEIREIIPYKASTSVPDTPKFIEGILNHRDDVIPIINLKERLKLGDFTPDNDSRILIITLNGRDVGFLVDEASQTVIVDIENIDDAPEYIGSVDKEYMTGVARLDDERLLILIDLERILSYAEIQELQEIE